MGIKERQERDREAVRRSILDAARELFVAEGYQNVSIRKVAERIEYSPAAIYSYFPSKDDIFFDLAEEGFRLLSHVAPEDEARYALLNPLERVRARFWHLYTFSREQPQYFSLIFLDRSVPRISREYERFAFARAGREKLLDDVRACIASNLLPETIDANSAFRLMSMGLFGVATLRLSGRITRTEDADALAADMLDTVIAGLQSGITLRASAVLCPDDAPHTTSRSHAS
jgi:AcrR family transcriptional regulator